MRSHTWSWMFKTPRCAVMSTKKANSHIHFSSCRPLDFFPLTVHELTYFVNQLVCNIENLSPTEPPHLRMIRHATEHWMNFSRESLKLMVIYSFRSDKIDGLCYSTQYMFPFKGFITQRFSGVRCGDMLSTRQFNPPLTSLNLSYPLLHFFLHCSSPVFCKSNKFIPR